MTSAPGPNTPARTYGAVMVSGTLWTAYTFGPGALLFTKYSSGPLILWAKPGEEENIPDPLTPAPSALEVRAVEMNTRAAFERLYWAAGGKVRPSVRSETARKMRRRGPLRRRDEEAKRLLCIRRILGYKDDSKYYCKIRTFIGDLGNRLMRWLQEAPNLRDERPMSRYLSYLIKKAIRSPTNLASGLTAYLGAEKGLVGILFFEHLEAAAYRAHLAKRVKPVTRRPRAPRPLYAKPRPPTAPTAPPLHEASA